MIQVALQNAKRAFLGMSHSPLLGLNPVSEEDQNAALLHKASPLSW